MKTSKPWAFVLVLSSLVVVTGCSSSNKNRGGTGMTTVTGSGVSAQEDRAVAGFTGLVMSSIGNVHVTVGGAEALRVEAEDNLLDHIETFVQGGSLVIQTEPGVDLQPTLPIEFQLTVTSLDNVLLSGVGDIDASGLTGNPFTITLSGVGDIVLPNLTATGLTIVLSGVGTVLCLGLDADQINATLSGVGDIRLSGQVDSQSAVISGVGEYDAEDLQSTAATITTSSVGSATVRVSTTLNVTISGSGSVSYIGSPAVTSTITGTGSLTQISP